MNGNTKEIKYSLSREEMIDLLKKYPFLVYRNVFSGEKSHDTLDEDIEYNQWTSWDGSGWEHIWKRYLTYLFIEYDKLNEKVQNLSGGQKQRVNLARSLAFPSQILLLDEPFSSLDEENRRRIIKFLSDFLSNGKKTVIFVTHNKKEAELLNCKSYSL